MTKEKAFLLGLFLADGTENGEYITFCPYDEFLKKLSKNLVNEIYGIKGKNSTKEGDIIFYSKNMLDDLHKYVPTIIHLSNTQNHVPEIIRNDVELSRSFLKGYFSCDGCVLLLVRKNGNLLRKVSLTSYNKWLLNDICEMLTNLKIFFRVNNKRNVIDISSKISILLFKELIGFLPVLIKGKYWVDISKDKLLNFLIASYSEKMPKFNSKDESYNHLKNIYNSLEFN